MKHLARKHVNGASQSQANKFLRVSMSKDEIYAYILRLLGNSMCMVRCVDGYDRLCQIRGKFTGRSKRENALGQGTWVLIGLRQWDADKEFAKVSSKTEKKIQKCDLLEIYSSSEREKLRVQEKIFQDLINEGVGSDGDSDGDGEFKTNYTVEFKDQKTLEYQEIIAQGGKLTKLSSATSYHTIYDQISDSDDGDSDGERVDGGSGSRGGEDRGSDDRGSGSRGSGSRGSDDRGSGSRGGEDRCHTAAAPTKVSSAYSLEEVDIDDI